MPEPSTLLFDTVVLSNFALAGRLDVLTARYAARMAATTEVLDEVVRGIIDGYAIEGVMSLADSGALETIALTAGDRTRYQSLVVTLGAGEASLVALAARRAGTVATDDRAARDACHRAGIPVTGTIGILRSAVRDNQLSPSEADSVLEKMVACGYYSPVASISSTL